MSLIQSISGIRGTIGGRAGENLTPPDIVRFAAAYACWLCRRTPERRPRIVLGRDARLSGEMVASVLKGTLTGCGVDVLDIGMATTPTTEMAVTYLSADGGVILTASHNPVQWNALKLLNASGEFLSAEDGRQLTSIIDRAEYRFVPVEELGHVTIVQESMLDMHIDRVLALPLVRADLIREAGFTVVVDAVNSIGGEAIPQLLERLGVKQVVKINCEPTGRFAHVPEPLPENLQMLSDAVRQHRADLGIAVDPDVDRLALVNNDGTMFGEEYTLVAVADYVLSHTPENVSRNTVSNLSSSRALRDVTERHGGKYAASAVGEVNVTTLMKSPDIQAVIGGEGNGGVIYPALHYGRDALVGVALFLSHLAEQRCTMLELRRKYPSYVISKNKISLSPSADIDRMLAQVKAQYACERITDIDGVRIDFESRRAWVHLRRSNTEPIVRVYAESESAESADRLAQDVMRTVEKICESNG